jgi:hypothetical protein
MARWRAWAGLVLLAAAGCGGAPRGPATAAGPLFAREADCREYREMEAAGAKAAAAKLFIRLIPDDPARPQMMRYLGEGVRLRVLSEAGGCARVALDGGRDQEGRGLAGEVGYVPAAAVRPLR